MMKLAKNFTEENFNKMFEFWVESNDESWLGNPAIWVSNIQIIPTLEKLDESWRPAIDRRASEELEMIDDYVAVLSHDHAIYVLKAKYTINDIDGNTYENLMTATTVYVKKNGVWKILHYHQSWAPEKQKTQEEKKTEK